MADFKSTKEAHETAPEVKKTSQKVWETLQQSPDEAGRQWKGNDFVSLELHQISKFPLPFLQTYMEPIFLVIYSVYQQIFLLSGKTVIVKLYDNIKGSSCF